MSAGALAVDGRAPAAVASVPADRRSDGMPAPEPPRRRLRPLTGVVALVGLLLTAALTWSASHANGDSERALLELETRQVAAALSEAVPSVQTSLVDAFQVVSATKASPSAFERFMASKVGPGRQFVSASLWRVAPGTPRRLVTAGATPSLVTDHDAAAFLSHLRPSALLQLTSILPGPTPRIGYAEMPPGTTSHLVIYAEGRLPPAHKLVVPASSPFGNLDFALYLGRTQSPAALIESSVPVPVKGLRHVTTVPFGDSAITLVATPAHPLTPSLSRWLAWIVLCVGILLSLGTAAIVELVARRRQIAERLAEENRRLFVEQRGIAATLQHALVPAVLPRVEGVELAVRYLAGETGTEVGGDWYDVIEAGPNRFVFVIGDVSGRGIRAATTMASLRFAVRAYVAEGHSPDAVLAKLGGIGVEDQQFATVLVGELDLTTHRLSLASAGHFPPLLVGTDGAGYVDEPAAPPIGAIPPSRPVPVVIDLAEDATLLAFTDGLVERRGEHLDVGLDRLRQLAARPAASLDDLLDTLLGEMIPGGVDDDVAVLALRWHRRAVADAHHSW